MRGILSMLLIVSVVLTVQGSIDCSSACGGYIPWAVACGAVSTAVCVLGLFVSLDENGTKFLAIFIFLWWCAGAGILTFAGPFKYRSMSNAYVSCWVAFLLAGQAFSSVFGAALGVHSWFGVLLLGSAVELAQAAQDCSNGCKNELAYAVAVGAVSTCICFIVMIWTYSKGGSVPHLKAVSIFLFLWWAAGWGVLTFQAPYTTGGNGFFASWVSLLSSGAIFFQHGLGRSMPAPDSYTKA